MSDELVTIATFQFLPKAQASKLLLESEGLTVFLLDAELVNTDWFLANAIGNIKLQVPQSQAEAAMSLLEESHGENPQADNSSDDSDADQCLGCGATLPDDATTCPACGWSYLQGEDD
jgi:hypothetical protein